MQFRELKPEEVLSAHQKPADVGAPIGGNLAITAVMARNQNCARDRVRDEEAIATHRYRPGTGATVRPV